MNSTNERKLWQRYIALFVLGGWLGAAVFLVLYGNELEELMLMNQNLKLQYDRLSDEMDNLKESQKEQRKRQEVTIEEIRIEVLEPKPDAYTETEVTRRLEKDLAPLRGKRVEQVGEVQAIIHEMLRRREYVVEGRTAEVRVKTVVISRIIRLYLTIEVKNETIGLR
ncbi:hypothetical protein LOK74_03360 [Brevibacillus humidisoli]|uniref:hypothetical protein n=1 Tax=Brevibacillus humidisoli TaxID=2895522 RepID=UPI001E60753D|nr:hypothetical protein [Brevibacillus humidisoli]UFJ41582.1 hypothetical protein LOK74_03360 [Brevibacillus humidisoli]